MVNDRARQILSYIQKFTYDHGYPPTIREVGKAFGIQSTNGVRYYLHMLEQAGHLKRSGRISRGIGPMIGRRDPGLPILGRVAAGTPNTRVRITVVMNKDVAWVIWWRPTSDGMLAASAGAKTWPAELNSTMMRMSGHGCPATPGTNCAMGMRRTRNARIALHAIIRVRLSWRSAYTPAGALSRTLGSVYAIISSEVKNAR